MGFISTLRVIAGLAMLATALPALAAPQCSAAQAADGDRWAWLSSSDTSRSVKRHLPWGRPAETVATSNERLVVLTDYVNQFDDDLLIPIWSAERVVWKRLEKVSRIDCFRPHPRMLPQSDLEDDYDEEIYDQGHLTPADDHDSSVRAMVNTFFYTNMTPQTGRFNRVTWRRLEAVVKGWAKAKGTLYVISGSILDRDGDGQRDTDSAAERMEPRRNRPARVAVPTAFYKIIAYRNPDRSLTTLSIVLPHNDVQLTGEALGQHFKDRVTTISQIEGVTGLDFFPEGPTIAEASAFCTFAGGAPRSLCQ